MSNRLVFIRMYRPVLYIHIYKERDKRIRKSGVKTAFFRKGRRAVIFMFMCVCVCMYKMWEVPVLILALEVVKRISSIRKKNTAAQEREEKEKREKKKKEIPWPRVFSVTENIPRVYIVVHTADRYILPFECN